MCFVHRCLPQYNFKKVLSSFLIYSGEHSQEQFAAIYGSEATFSSSPVSQNKKTSLAKKQCSMQTRLNLSSGPRWNVLISGARVKNMVRRKWREISLELSIFRKYDVIVLLKTIGILLRLSQLNESSRCIISVHIIWNALSVVKHWTHNEANSGYSKSMQQLCSNFWNFETHLAIHQRLEVLAKRIALHKSRSSRELSLSRVSMKSKINNDIVLSWVYRREHSSSPGCGTKKQLYFFPSMALEFLNLTVKV